MLGSESAQSGRDDAAREARVRAANARYWGRSCRLVAGLLVVWFSVSFGCGILFRDALDRFTLPGTGFPLGFWFAQQGAIVIFVLLIGVYVILASRLDAALEVERNQIAFDMPADSEGPADSDTSTEGQR